MNPRKLKKKLVSYIKFKELARSIKLVALSQLSNLKKKISTRGIPLSSVIPFFDRKSYTGVKFKNCLLIPIGVDKSCCGPHNGNIFKKTDEIVERLVDQGKKPNIFAIGKRTKDYVKKYYSHYYVGNIHNIDKEPLSFTLSSFITEKICFDYYDKYYFIFNRYYSPFTQKTKVYEIYGPTQFNQVSLNLKNTRKSGNQQDYFSFVFNNDDEVSDKLISSVYTHSFSMIVLDALEENEYSSLGARVTAMDNSGQNAVKMIEKMTLLYNKARQASITNELIEIVSAANFV